MALIDRDAAIEAISVYLFINDAIVSPVPKRVADYNTFAESILKEVAETDIVRCKECRYYIDNMPEDSTDDECRWRSEEQPNADDYCSYGEREGE